MKNQNINDTNLYKKNVHIHKSLTKVYIFALAVGIAVLVIKGIIL